MLVIRGHTRRETHHDAVSHCWKLLKVVSASAGGGGYLSLKLVVRAIRATRSRTERNDIDTTINIMRDGDTYETA